MAGADRVKNDRRRTVRYPLPDGFQSHADISLSIRTLVGGIHNDVEKHVDNHVDNIYKPVIATVLYRFA